MHSNACFALVLLCLAAVQAIPAGKIEKKTVSDEPTLGMSDLKLVEEAGDSKDRPKKSTICVDIRPDGEAGQVRGGATSVQTLNLVPQAQLASQIQTYNLQPVMQPVQALSVMQAPQLAQQSIYVPQQMVPPVQTLQIIQSPQQPCPEAKQETELIPETTPAPAPATTTQPPRVEKPAQLERLQKVVKVEQKPHFDTVNVMHMASPCNEQIDIVPSRPVMTVSEPQRLSTLIQVPSCPHHTHQAGVSQCTCRNQGYAAARSADMRTDPMHFARQRNIDDGQVQMIGQNQLL